MHDLIKLQEQKETAVLVAVVTQLQNEDQTREYLDELEFLARTINIEAKATFTQKLEKPDKRTFIGKGKFEEVIAFVQEHEIDSIIFDDDLTPSQVRNIENETGKKVYDRSLLILDIFLYRAKTAQARTQVELARSEYLLPRLTRMWTPLERQRGGTGTRGGAGEKEIETDRRMVRNKISVLKKKLEKIEQQAITQRKSRGQQVRVSLVGYTNVGKSTLMNVMSKSEVFAEDKLFATVDSTVRKVVVGHLPFLLTDTVGFIRKLPHSLVECFKSTLDEIREADVLLHVIDLSHPFFEDQLTVVKETLNEIKAGEKPTILVFNKIDTYNKRREEIRAQQEELGEEAGEVPPSIEELQESYLGKGENAIFISAGEKENIEEFKQLLFKFVSEKFYTIFPNYLRTDYYGQVNQEEQDGEDSVND